MKDSSEWAQWREKEEWVSRRHETLESKRTSVREDMPASFSTTRACFGGTGVIALFSVEKTQFEIEPTWLSVSAMPLTSCVAL